MKKNEATAKRPRANPDKATAEDNGHSMLTEFFHEQLKDIYWAEKHLIKTLPKMQKAASSQELQELIARHLDETKEHVIRLETIFDLLGYKAQAKKCEAMDGITKEGDSIIEETEQGTATRDVGLIMAAQKAEHYEIATYGGLTQLSRTLGNDKIAGILESTLKEEKEIDEMLTDIAENSVNYESSQEPAEA